MAKLLCGLPACGLGDEGVAARPPGEEGDAPRLAVDAGGVTAVLAKVGPAENFTDYSVFSKILLSLNMLVGRLEILPMLVFFTPTVWKKT